MIERWRRSTIGAEATLQRGFDITRRSLRPGRIPVVSSSGVAGFHDTAAVEGPGVIIGRKGSLGTVFYLDEDYWPHDTTLWVRDFHGNCPRFVYYFFKTLSVGHLDVGAANPTLNRNHVHPIEVQWPPLRTQRKIAAILSAYDDLIENNTRRIAILEEMARALYTEWFVRFRFPGHEAYRMVDSPLGPVPEGWEVAPIGSVYSALYDGPHATPSPSDDGPVFLGIKNLTEGGTLDLSDVRHIAENDFPSWTKRVLPQPGDVVFTYEATLDRYAMIPPGFRGCLGRRVALIRPNPDRMEPALLLRYLLSQRWHTTIAQHTIPGSTVDRIPLSDLPSFDVLVPPARLRQKVGPVFQALESQIQCCVARNTTLQRTRDRLLPKLVSGEIDVGAIGDDEVCEREEGSEASTW